MSDAIAKGKLSAYQRWEMSSFEEESGSQSRKASLDELRLKAQKEGFAKGFEEGRQTGINMGRQEVLPSLQQELASIKNIGTEFSTAIGQAEKSIAQDVLDLALDLAKAMLKSTLEVKPELLIPIIEEAVASLPSVQQPAQLFVSPKDAPLVSEKIGADLTSAGWVIMSDIHLQPGDCRIETNNNQIDGTLAARWMQLTEALGRDNTWLDKVRR